MEEAVRKAKKIDLRVVGEAGGVKAHTRNLFIRITTEIEARGWYNVC